ncbi:MAG: type II secretion system protein GspE [Betaproteobacteria bacterium SG8_40]|jgi:general secretion pathway protein E|nr:MAG: type II secretion system protein GspE [Betaproteobacteria bacterium SG8_40]
MSQLVPYSFARAQRVLTAGERDGSLLLWVTDRTLPAAIVELRRSLARDLTPVLVSDAQFEEGLRAAYVDGGGGAASVVDEVESEVDLDRLMQDIPDVEDLLDEKDDAPIVRMLNAMLSQAVREGASDVHIEPFESYSVVRYRVDGTLRDVVRPRSALHAALISRIKIMANMDIAEKRLPQDGRIMLRLGGRPIDVRVSTLPAAHGERIVLRLLDKERGSLSPEKLGMAPDTLASFSELVRQSHGIVLVTGPTGSGKTTTLYAMLSRLDSQTTNILTVEDPIEFDLPGIGQTQVNPRIDMTFARALRAILRQDPDVIMIGEIRDRETAQIAVQASLTGHLVLATLHTNDSVSAVTRLLDMGIEPFLLSSTLLGVLGQRLLRKLCPECREIGDDGYWHARGCPACLNSGYVGRTGAYELLRVDEAMRQAIHAKEGESRLRVLAMEQGFRSIRDDCGRWLTEGTTSLEEVTRVSREQ